MSYNPDEKLIKRPGDDTPLTEWEQDEWLRCALDKYYFFENYVWVQTPSGRRRFKPRPYQERILDTCQENRFVIGLAGRQSGKTAALACDILHEIIFTEDYQVLIGSYSNSQALDFMDRIAYSYTSLPWWLKPPAIVFNKFSIRFDNDSSVVGQTFTSRFGRGRSNSRIVLDELAFGDKKLVDEMMASLIPSISADGENSTTKLNIISTPNGTANEFSHIWHSAIESSSQFKAVEVKYEEVPGRTEKFEEDMLNTPGMTRDKFDQEFRCHFISSSGTLINSRFLEEIESKKPERTHGDFSLFTNSFKGKKIALSCDPAEGVGEDSSSIQLFDIETFEQLGEYANNMVNQSQLTAHMVQIIRFMFEEGASEIYYCYESNGIGSGIGILIDNVSDPVFEKAVMINDPSRMAKGKTGMATTSKTKKEACGQFKDMIEMGKITIKSQKLLNELKTFVKRGSGFEAEPGNHDDRVSACLLFVRLLDELRNYEDSVDDMISEVSLPTAEDEEFSEIYF